MTAAPWEEVSTEVLHSLRCGGCGRLLARLRAQPRGLTSTTIGGDVLEIVCPDSRCHRFNAFRLADVLSGE